ncbi:MAG: hypothetical protein ABJC13_06435 [Acidobacteriota bacterium]
MRDVNPKRLPNPNFYPNDPRFGPEQIGEGSDPSDPVLAGVSQARDLTLVGGRLFFVAFRPETGTELWISEGTAETTHMVTDLRPGPRGSAPQFLKVVGHRVVFAADDGLSGLEPWSSDGTPEGTVRLGDIAPGRDASTPGAFSIANGQLLFGADDGEHGRELWAIPFGDVVGAAVR